MPYYFFQISYIVHISKITDKYIKHPSEVLSVGDERFQKKSLAKMEELINF